MTKKFHFNPSPAQPEPSCRVSNHTDMTSRNDDTGFSNPFKPCTPWKNTDHTNTVPLIDSVGSHKHAIAYSAAHAKKMISPNQKAPSSSSSNQSAGDTRLATSPLDEMVDELIEHMGEQFKLYLQALVSSALGASLPLGLVLLWVFTTVFLIFVIACTVLVVLWEAFLVPLLQDRREMMAKYWGVFEQKMMEKRRGGGAPVDM